MCSASATESDSINGSSKTLIRLKRGYGHGGGGGGGGGGHGGSYGHGPGMKLIFYPTIFGYASWHVIQVINLFTLLFYVGAGGGARGPVYFCGWVGSKMGSGGYGGYGK